MFFDKIVTSFNLNNAFLNVNFELGFGGIHLFNLPQDSN
jgi:hypothetical protein